MHFHKAKLLVILQFDEYANVVPCCECDCLIVVCRMPSDVHVKYNKFKSEFQQVFVTCLFQFCAHFALFIIIY